MIPRLISAFVCYLWSLLCSSFSCTCFLFSRSNSHSFLLLLNVCLLSSVCYCCNCCQASPTSQESNTDNNNDNSNRSNDNNAQGTSSLWFVPVNKVAEHTSPHAYHSFAEKVGLKITMSKKREIKRGRRRKETKNLSQGAKRGGRACFFCTSPFLCLLYCILSGKESEKGARESEREKIVHSNIQRKTLNFISAPL